MNGQIALLLCASAFSAAAVAAGAVAVGDDGPNMLRNANFAEFDENGVPQQWSAIFQGQGDNRVSGRASLAPGPDGKPAVKLQCTEFPSPVGNAWVIFAQDGAVKTRMRQKLYISFWIKQLTSTKIACPSAIRIIPKPAKLSSRMCNSPAAAGHDSSRASSTRCRFL